jgi:adenylosuccinate lyase
VEKFNSYLSPFSWRYASQEMRNIWGERYKRLLWRNVWLSLAETQAEYGLVTSEQVEDLRNHVSDIDIQRSIQIEAEIHHDLMAEIKTFAEKCDLGGAIIHLGATSMDIEDNAEVIRQKQALEILLVKLKELLILFANKILQYSNTPVIAFTHLQPAEASTLGYRLANYAQDLWQDWLALTTLDLRGKGFKGAVGTAASYIELLGAGQFEPFENRMAERLNISFYEVSNQVYPRKQDFSLLNALASLGASLYRFAFDLRVLQSPLFGEMSEPFAEKQIGSSAMPFKRNPILCEKINSLTRQLSTLPQVAWQNAGHSLLERTLDDSANRRSLIPEAFLIADEVLLSTLKIIKGLNINEKAIQRNHSTYAPFASTERLLMALVKNGADRQEMHARLRGHAMTAWAAIQLGNSNPLLNLVLDDPDITLLLPIDKVNEIMQDNGYLGFAPQRSRDFALKLLSNLT